MNTDIDLAILDISMPRMTGLQAARELQQRRPALRILILSMHESEQYLYEALKVGASGYVVKRAADHDLVDACRAAIRGEPFLYPEAVAQPSTTIYDAHVTARRYAIRSRRARPKSSSSSRRATPTARSQRRW